MDNKETIAIAKNLIREAYDKVKDVIYDCDTTIRKDRPLSAGDDINLSSMFTLLVQETGRYAERFASDVIISIESLEKAISNITENSEPQLFLFGIRQNGVDHLEYVCSQMSTNVNNPSYFNEYYRKMYAIELAVETKHERPTLIVRMKDVHNEIAHAVYALQDAVRNSY